MNSIKILSKLIKHRLMPWSDRLMLNNGTKLDIKIHLNKLSRIYSGQIY